MVSSSVVSLPFIGFSCSSCDRGFVATTASGSLTASPRELPNTLSPERERRSPRGVFFGALVLGAAIVAHLPGLDRQLFDSDEAAIATLGNVVAHGGVLYRDAIDRKPPLAPLLYALSFLITGARDLQPLHLLLALEIGAAALILAAEARRLGGVRAGWWAAGLLIASTIATTPIAGQAANYSQLALLPACGAIVAARRGTGRSAVLAGVLLGIAVLTRQTWILGLAPATVAAWLTGGRRASRALSLVTATACTIATVAVIAPFGGFLHWTFTGNTSILDMGQSSHIAQRAWVSVSLFLVGHLAVVWLAARRGIRWRDIDLWLWVGSGLVAVVAGFRFFDHYWFQVLPALCLLAAVGVARANRAERVLLVALVAWPAVVGWHDAWTTTRISHDWGSVVSAIGANSNPDDRITVWGSVPELYWLSGRNPGGGMITTDFVVGRTAGRPDGPQRLADATPGAQHQFVDSLRTTPPRLFLDTSTAGIRGYSHYPIHLVPPVAAFVHDHYHEIAVVQRITIYARDVPQPSIGRHRRQ